MRKNNNRLIILFILFAICMAIICFSLLIFSSYTISKTFSEMNNQSDSYIMISNSQLEQSTQEGILNKYIDPVQFSKYYQKSIINQSIIILILFFLFFTLVSIVFWRLILHQKRKSDLKLLQDLDNVIHNNVLDRIDPSFLEISNRLKKTYDYNIIQYQRLYSYLSHEQKNRISILSSDIKLTNHPKLNYHLDKLNSGLDDVLTLSDHVDYEQINDVDILMICAALCDEYSKVHSNITFLFDEEYSNLFIVRAKARWIECAVGNLLNNAVKYSLDKPITLSIEKKKKTIIIKVTDLGLGISQDKLEQIFSYSYRVNQLNNDGYGIGLSLVMHVCNLCNGFIFVESEIGYGSTFTLSFPASE